jgi:hypothetical protein
MNFMSLDVTKTSSYDSNMATVRNFEVELNTNILNGGIKKMIFINESVTIPKRKVCLKWKI